MYRPVYRFCLALALLAALAACGTTPDSRHYLLRAHDYPPPQTSALSIGIGQVAIPEYLQRNNMLFSTDGNRIDVARTERWAEPLGDGVSRVLALNLGGLLQTQDVRIFPWNPRHLPAYAVEVRVLQLDAAPGKATLIADWLLFRPGDDDTPLARHIASLEAPLAGSAALAEQVAQAYSELFYQLSERIADAVRAAENQGQHNEN